MQCTNKNRFWWPMPHDLVQICTPEKQERDPPPPTARFRDIALHEQHAIQIKFIHAAQFAVHFGNNTCAPKSKARPQQRELWQDTVRHGGVISASERALRTTSIGKPVSCTSGRTAACGCCENTQEAQIMRGTSMDMFQFMRGSPTNILS
jgi:hypothetical protein